MKLSELVNQNDMSQKKVCNTLRKMDIKIKNMLSLIMQSSNVVEKRLADVAIDYLIGKKYRSPIYYGNINKYSLLLLKLSHIKNIEKTHKIIKKIGFTRDFYINIIEYFLTKTKNYKYLIKDISKLCNDFYDNGKNVYEYNKIINQLVEIEKSIEGRRNYLFGAIRNIECMVNDYYTLRNTIVLSYLKLNLGIVCRTTNRIQDNFQNGILGILRAIDKSVIDKLASKEYSFANFVKWHIKNSLANPEFNPRTDLVFNVHPQILKQISSSELKKMIGERYIDEIIESTSFISIPEYLQDSTKESILNDNELNIISLLYRDPSECKFSLYPSEKELSEEINKQKSFGKK